MAKREHPPTPRQLRPWRPPRPMGLARALMKAGYATRAAAEQMVRDGRVQVGGAVVTDPRRQVGGDDEISLDGMVLRRIERRYFAFNKPLRVACRPSDGPDRKQAGDFFPPEVVGLQTAGRLDVNTGGLLLVSNDTAWNTQVTDSATLEHEYRVQVEGELTTLEMTILEAGIHLAGLGLFRPLAISLREARQGRSLVAVTVRGGQARHLRRMFATMRHKVFQIRRVRLGSISLGDLSVGKMRPLTVREIASLIADPVGEDAGGGGADPG